MDASALMVVLLIEVPVALLALWAVIHASLKDLSNRMDAHELDCHKYRRSMDKQLKKLADAMSEKRRRNR